MTEGIVVEISKLQIAPIWCKIALDRTPVWTAPPSPTLESKRCKYAAYTRSFRAAGNEQIYLFRTRQFSWHKKCFHVVRCYWEDKRMTSTLVGLVLTCKHKISIQQGLGSKIYVHYECRYLWDHITHTVSKEFAFWSNEVVACMSNVPLPSSKNKRIDIRRWQDSNLRPRRELISSQSH